MTNQSATFIGTIQEHSASTEGPSHRPLNTASSSRDGEIPSGRGQFLAASNRGEIQGFAQIGKCTSYSIR